MRGFILLITLLISAPASAQDYESARVAADLRELCRTDNGELWGVSLCGPVIVADPATRAVWASDPDPQGQLTQSPEGWRGALPPGVPIANSVLEWGGARWIMLVGPLPTDAVERRVLVGHEAWHLVQAELGFPMSNSSNAHLATARGRTLMRLEMRALAAALRSSGNARARAAEDALAFRRARYAEFSGAFAEEAALDRNEGLAAYTGVRLAAPAPEIYAARTLDEHDGHDALARAYAYATGPAYGLLLDAHSRTWRRSLGASAPADMLASTIRARTLNDRELRRAAERYGGSAITAEEQAREQQQAQRLADIRRRFGAGARRELPLAAMQMEFNPNQTLPVEGLGTYYEVLTIRDRWGEVRATQGAVISTNFDRLFLAEPAPDQLSGPGWRLSLSPGFQVVPPPSFVAPPNPIPAP